VILYGDANRRQDVVGPLSFLRKGLVLIKGVFPLLHSFDDAVDLAY
jgi:hypothetical protein